MVGRVVLGDLSAVALSAGDAFPAPKGGSTLAFSRGAVLVNGRQVKQNDGEPLRVQGTLVGEPTWSKGGTAVTWLERDGEDFRLVALRSVSKEAGDEKPIRVNRQKLPSNLDVKYAEWASETSINLFPVKPAPTQIGTQVATVSLR